MTATNCRSRRRPAELHLTFELGGSMYGVPFLRVAEAHATRSLVFTLERGQGWVTLHDERIPVRDLRVRFGLAAPFDENTRLMVVFVRRPGRDDERVGLIVDRFGVVAPLPCGGPDSPASSGEPTVRLLDVDLL